MKQLISDEARQSAVRDVLTPYYNHTVEQSTQLSNLGEHPSTETAKHCKNMRYTCIEEILENGRPQECVRKYLINLINAKNIL